MKKIRRQKKNAWVAGLMTVVWLLFATVSHAAIEGITGTTFDLTATIGTVVTSDGDSFQFWGYSTPASNNGNMQYPGPTLIVNEGDTITINLTNNLPPQAGATSIVFPGHNVTASGDNDGILTWEANNGGGTASYSFTATNPGTYLYRSGTNTDLQVEMGLVGVIIVRPAMGANYAYNHADTQFDREFLLILTEMNPNIHRFTELGLMALVDTSDNRATNWFINGRNFPDNVAAPYAPWLPNQPYNFVPQMHPGEKVLVRSVGAGNDLHPFHYHGNNFEVIGVDGRMLTTGGGMGPNLSWKATTRRTVPGQTAEVIWTWNAEKLGWDMYDHQPGVDYPRSDINPAWPGIICDNFDPLTFDPENPPAEEFLFDTYTKEYCPDHGVQFPVILPQRDSLTYGDFYPGTPFLGGEGDLAPGDAGLNSTAAFFLIWHSHTEKELTSNDIWPGGAISFMLVEHPGVDID